jgi:hypothetical protein
MSYVDPGATLSHGLGSELRLLLPNPRRLEQQGQLPPPLDESEGAGNDVPHVGDTYATTGAGDIFAIFKDFDFSSFAPGTEQNDPPLNFDLFKTGLDDLVAAAPIPIPSRLLGVSPYSTLVFH